MSRTPHGSPRGVLELHRRARASRAPRASRAFTFIELLIVVSIIAILAVLIVPTFTGMRAKKLRNEALLSVPSLRSFEFQYFNRTGSFVYSRSTSLASDRVRWGVATMSTCEDRRRETTFQVTLADPEIGWSPTGCQWQYYVIDDRCDPDCASAGSNDACQGTGTCFCVIAEPRPGLGFLEPNEKYCSDDLGRQYDTTDKVISWN